MAAAGRDAVAQSVMPVSAPAVTSACPPQSGIAVRADSGVPSLTALAPRTGVLDTAWRFDITERTWTRPSYSASIAVGLDEPRGAAKLRVCAGASVVMSQPTLTVRGARGTVRVRADFTDLEHFATPHAANSSRP